MNARIALLAVTICLLLGGRSLGAEAKEVFGGVAITVAQIYDQDRADHRGELVVLKVARKSPAARAGIQPGDLIVAVDGHETSGAGFEDAVRKYLRGVPGSVAEFTIRRAGEPELLVVKVKRVPAKG